MQGNHISFLIPTTGRPEKTHHIQEAGFVLPIARERIMSKASDQSGSAHREQAASPTGQAQSAADYFPLLNPAGFASSFDPLLQAGNRILQNWQVVNNELLEFGKTQLSRSFDVGQRLARSNSVDQTIETQTDYARSALNDYINETGKLIDLSTRAMFDTFSLWQADRKAAGGNTTSHAASLTERSFGQAESGSEKIASAARNAAE